MGSNLKAQNKIRFHIYLKLVLGAAVDNLSSVLYNLFDKVDRTCFE